MLPELQKQFLQADLVQARLLLADGIAFSDPIAEHQYRQRVVQLEKELEVLARESSEAPVGVALFFGGRPVVGSHGIKATFGSQAVGKFQKLVSQRYAALETGPLSRKGRVPLSDETQLLVTDVVRGSFGFVLQASQRMVDDSVLGNAVDEVADTLSRMSAEDEALFDEASAQVDERQLSALREFFKLLDDEGASLRIVEGQRDFELTSPAVQRGRQRADALVLEDRQETLEGEVIGWAEYSGRFELRLHEGGTVVTGAVSTEAMQRVSHEGVNPLHSHVRVFVKVREARMRNRLPKRSFDLLSMEPIDPPEGTSQRLTQSSL